MKKNSRNSIGFFLKQKRKATGLTQEEFAIRSGLGLRFVRELEQGKQTVRLDKVNQALAMFGYEAAPVKIARDELQTNFCSLIEERCGRLMKD